MYLATHELVSLWQNSAHSIYADHFCSLFMLFFFVLLLLMCAGFVVELFFPLCLSLHFITHTFYLHSKFFVGLKNKPETLKCIVSLAFFAIQVRKFRHFCFCAVFLLFFFLSIENILIASQFVLVLISRNTDSI